MHKLGKCGYCINIFWFGHDLTNCEQEASHLHPCVGIASWIGPSPNESWIRSMWISYVFLCGYCNKPWYFLWMKYSNPMVDHKCFTSNTHNFKKMSVVDFETICNTYRCVLYHHLTSCTLHYLDALTCMAY
jgi:hypothetical protein